MREVGVIYQIVQKQMFKLGIKTMMIIILPRQKAQS